MRGRHCMFSLLAGLLLSACNGEDLGLRLGDGEPRGRLDLAVTDAPADDATAVVVRFTGLELQHSDGRRERTVFDTPKNVDLRTLTAGKTSLLLDDHSLPAGRYQWLRLLSQASADSTDSYVDTTLGRFPLAIAGETGLQFTGEFSIPTDGTADLVVDFDLRKGLSQSADRSYYLLRPALRLIDAAADGAIAGSVASALITAANCDNGAGDDIGNIVYVYAGADVIPDDLDGDAGDPLTTAAVTLDGATGHYRYQLSFLDPGSYTLAFTCQARGDDAQANDSLAFTVARTVTVSTDATAQLDF